MDDVQHFIFEFAAIPLHRRCYEFRCANMVFNDNYDVSIDRSNVCYDTTGSLIIKIIDT